MREDDTMMVPESNNEKHIIIQGQSNRYLMKKLKKEVQIVKKRVVTNNWNIPNELMSLDKQCYIVSSLLNKNGFDINCDKIIQKELTVKLSGYKQQDIDSNKYNSDSFISFDSLIKKLDDSYMLCYYCKGKMYLLYENVREKMQWTLDRMDNNTGHNESNVVIACLECNLKRRRTNKDAFLFTKQMVLVKSE